LIWPFTPWARPRRAGAEIDRWLPPGARRLEHHALDCGGTPAAALSALQALTLRELPVVRALFAIRGLPSRPDLTLRDLFSTPPFVLLADEPGREVVFAIGIAHGTRSALRTATALPRASDAFRSAAGELAFVAIGNFRAEAAARGALLWTETWAATSGAMATATFTAYWLAIGAFSAWTRRLFLRGAAVRLDRA
jgi:hypothetical protein